MPNFLYIGARLWSSSKSSWRISPAGQELYCWGWRHHFLQGRFPVICFFSVLKYSLSVQRWSWTHGRKEGWWQEEVNVLKIVPPTLWLLCYWIFQDQKNNLIILLWNFFSVQLCRYNLVTRQQDMLYEARILQKSVHLQRGVLRLKNHGESAEAEAKSTEGGPCGTRFGHRWAAAWDGPGF